MAESQHPGEPILQARDINVSFRIRGAGKREFTAVNDVSLQVRRGETLAVVGESGSGKSTLARALLQLVDHRGSVELLGQHLESLARKEMRTARSGIQMVFQDPYSSLNPTMAIRDIIAEPLRVHTSMTRDERMARVAELLELVGLHPEHGESFPSQMSGGQRQRVAIARAVATHPGLVIADEAVSALDVSTQNQIIRLLENLSSTLDVSYLFISHDLGVVRHIADRVMVMYAGRVVEEGPVRRVFDAPTHPYTRALLASALVADPERQRERRLAAAKAELAISPPADGGCSYRSRCPLAQDVCAITVPALRSFGAENAVACHVVQLAPDDDEPTQATGVVPLGHTRPGRD